MKDFHWLHYCVIMTFLICTIFPMLLTHNGKISPIEKRQLAPLPAIKGDLDTLKAFSADFSAFYDDHFGIRENLVHFYSLLHVWLRIPTADVIVGRDGWLFRAINRDYRNVELLTEQQLRRWQWCLETRYYWLKEQGIEYVFVITPDKHTIYREYLPSRIKKIGEKSAADQLVEYLANNSEVPVLDLRPPLNEAKFLGRLYHKTDTHWNALGASVAQDVIIKYLATKLSRIQPIEYRPEDFKFSEKKGGDLANMMNLRDELMEDQPVLRKAIPDCVYNKKQLPKKAYHPKKSQPLFFTECRQNYNIHALIFRDSFFTNLQPYMSRYFSKATYLWLQPNFEKLEKFTENIPSNVVVEERGERGLKYVPSIPKPKDKSYQIFLERRRLKALYQKPDGQS